MYDGELEYQPVRRGPGMGTVIVTSFLTAVIVFFGLRWAEQNGLLGKSQAGAVVDLPNIVGMTAADAREALKARGLLILLEAERDDLKIPAGSIAEQAPLPGSQLHRGATVKVVVSRGARQVAIPNVMGQTTEVAARLLAAAGLATGATRSAAAEAAPGIVVASTPVAGALVAPGAPVELTVSAGPATKAVPKVTGVRVSKAKEAVAAAGFTVGKVRYDYDADRPANVVLRQEPAEGVAAAPGAPIDLVVNEP